MRLSIALSSCASSTELRNRLAYHWTACLEFLVALEAGQDLEGEAESELPDETRSSAIVDVRQHCNGQPYHFWWPWGSQFHLIFIWHMLSQFHLMCHRKYSLLLPVQFILLFIRYVLWLRMVWVYRDHIFNWLHDAVWNGEKDTWRVCTILCLHRDPADDSCLCGRQQVMWPLWLIFFLGGGCVSVCLWEVGVVDLMNFKVFVVFSVLWSDSLRWVWLSQKFHFWELREFYTILFASYLCLSWHLNLNSAPTFIHSLFSPAYVSFSQFPVSSLTLLMASLPPQSPASILALLASPGSLFESSPRPTWVWYWRLAPLLLPPPGGVTAGWFWDFRKSEERAPFSLCLLFSCQNLWGTVHVSQVSA